MPQLRRITNRLNCLIARIASRFFPAWWKQHCELRFWEDWQKAKGHFSNAHYEYFYTAHFGLDASYYEGKVILDIGCGPMGSLEWASIASRRIGLDPLAQEYLKLRAERHQMEYIAAYAEDIPLGDGTCDAVCSFNSLDHVEDVRKTISEIKRITRREGIFLLIVGVNHPPTSCEPHDLTPGFLIDSLRPEFVCESLQLYQSIAAGVYESLKAGVRLPYPEDTDEQAYLSAMFRRSCLAHDASQRRE
jgi:ubiquinone/menaquinone biosynthesis C-methylase UbiE